MRVVRDIVQGSPEWLQALTGNPGASGFSNIITSTGKASTSRQKYLYQMAGEIITGERPETYKSAAMQRGNDLEPEARELFEFLHGPVEQVGLIYPDHTDEYHISPDGIMPDREEGLEIKCPGLPVAVEYLDKQRVPTEYVIQVQGSLMVTGYRAWWFMSYYPGLKPLILRVERDEILIEQIRQAVEHFCHDLKKLVARLK
jgi:predicted phage-related endonuclease